MSDSPVDRAVFTELRAATGQEFAAELVNTFLEEAPEMIAELKAAAAVGDADGFRRAAHSIKSNANIFGAGAMADMSRQMEVSGLEANGPGFAALDAEYACVATALRGLLDG